MYRILIVEDESEMRSLLVGYIRRSQPDLEVVGSAVNGKEALQLAEERHPDIVITDIAMPIMDGLVFLQEAAQRGLPFKTIIISGYDEFAYAKKAVALGVSEYLLKPFDPMELETVLNKIKDDLNKQQILLDNMELLQEKVEEGASLLKAHTLRAVLEGREEKRPTNEILDTSADYYCICLLKLPFYMGSERWNTQKQENVDELVTLLSASCLPKEIRAQGLNMAGNGVILALFGSAEERRTFFLAVKSGMEHLQKSMARYYGIRVVCIIGGVYDTWEQLKDSDQEALEVWRRLTSIDQTLIVCGQEPHSDAADEAPDTAKRIRALKEQILLSVRMGHDVESMRCLDELMQVYATVSPQQTDFIWISAEELVYAIFNEVERNGIRLDPERTNEEIQRRMKERLQYASLLEIRELLREYFSLCHKPFLEHNNRQQTEKIVENVKAMIEANLDNETLTLEWIADKLHFSAAYIRQVFKQKTGERMMEYVIHRRMEKAGSLLLKTDMKIQDVAAACGYSNPRYFASSFMKYYDCTPTEFKTMMEKEGPL